MADTETSTGWAWDDENCPRDDCNGDLQQQDKYNVMCLSCEMVWCHVRTERSHLLMTADFMSVAEKPVAMTDGGQEDDADRCDYCDTRELVYEFHPSRGGTVYRCIECLAIEQGQQKFELPFEVWLDRDDVEPPEADDAPDFESFDPREHDYKAVQAWFRVLARLKEDDPIVKRDPEAVGTICDDTREFLINVMGKDAHKRPSELRAQSAPDQSGGGDDGE